MKFKVGDIVQIISKAVESPNYENVVGKIAKIKDIILHEHLFRIFVRYFDENTEKTQYHVHNEKNLRKLSKEEMKNLWLYEI